MRSKPPFVNISQITSFETVLAELAELEDKLSADKLGQFRVFNKAYLLVTRDLQQAARHGYFSNPKFVEKFTVCFATYYFQAINDTRDVRPSLPAAWAMVNQANTYPSTPDFVFLLMGANAHINNDLPLALLRLVDEAGADNSLKDILRVDKLLMKSGKKIISAFVEPNEHLELWKRQLAFLYYRPVMYMILYWRIKAWRSYKSIKKRGVEGSTYPKGSIRIAKRFLGVARLLG